MLRNGEKDQFKTLVDHLQNQYALGTDQFPKTTTSAADIMGAHEVQNQNEKLKREKMTKMIKMIKMTKTQKQIRDRQTMHPEEGTNQATGKTRNCFVTYVVKKIISRQNASREIKSPTMIGISIN